jgi:hypothetical protein
MNKSFRDRLAELERLEASYAEPDPLAEFPNVALLSDTEIEQLIFEGLRSTNPAYLRAYEGEIWGYTAYWKAVAERAQDYIERKRRWIHPFTTEEAQALIEGLRSGQMLLYVRGGGYPPFWYDCRPPEPYPMGCWEWPSYRAHRVINHALRQWWSFHEGLPNPPEMPHDAPSLIAWLKACIVPIDGPGI